MKRLSIVDIAKALGISPSTVSRALQDHPDIRKATREMVQQYAREHNYRPNILASNLRTQKNKTIGIVLPTFRADLFTHVLRGIEEIAKQEGYQLLICQTDNNYENECADVRTLLTSQVAGIIACVSYETQNFDHMQEVLDSDVPLVLFYRQCPIDCDQVIADDYRGAFQAVEYLILTGSRRIAFYTTRPKYTTRPSANRLQGYKDALAHYAIPFDPSLVRYCNSRDEAITLGADLYDSPDRAEAVLTVVDLFAEGLMTAAKMMGARVPDELRIVGFNNADYVRHSDPMITSVDLHPIEMGRCAMQMLHERILGNTDAAKIRLLPADLILRETTK